MRAEAKTPSVAIIGAGFGGLAAAIELRRNGFDQCVVFERAEDVGGVWRANAYPGAACDVPSPTYSFSYELETRWSARYGTQPEIQRYLRRCADRYGITPRIRFRSEVRSAAFVDGRWELELVDGQRHVFDVLVCATGQLSRPRIPELPGRASFAGPQFHSAEWDPAVSVRGKRVAVVGSGASAVQLVPAIVDEVRELHVIQRSPNWVANKYNHRTSGALHRVLRAVPGLARLEHNMEWLWFEARVPLIYTALDPVRRLFEMWLRNKIRREIRDPMLRAAVTPDYKVGCNRILLSNDWYPTLDRAHVALHPQAVAEVVPEGVVLADGVRVEVDVIVWCTGFTAEEYLAPIDVTGRDGRKLHAEWKSGPEAYLGISVSGYPNMFLMYGPNTGSITNTIIFLLEKQARYVRMALRHIAGTGGWVDVRRAVQDRFNDRLRRRLARTVFTSGCPGWYHTADGKVFAVWPGSHIGYALATRRFHPARYESGHG